MNTKQVERVTNSSLAGSYQRITLPAEPWHSDKETPVGRDLPAPRVTKPRTEVKPQMSVYGKPAKDTFSLWDEDLLREEMLASVAEDQRAKKIDQAGSYKKNTMLPWNLVALELMADCGEFTCRSLAEKANITSEAVSQIIRKAEKRLGWDFSRRMENVPKYGGRYMVYRAITVGIIPEPATSKAR